MRIAKCECERECDVDVDGSGPRATDHINGAFYVISPAKCNTSNKKKELKTTADTHTRKYSGSDNTHAHCGDVTVSQAGADDVEDGTQRAAAWGKLKRRVNCDCIFGDAIEKLRAINCDTHNKITHIHRTHIHRTHTHRTGTHLHFAQ